MNLNTFAIGILFNKKMFRISSLGGVVIDEILRLRDNENKISEDFFTKVSTSKTKENEYSLTLVDDDNTNKLLIQTTQFVFTKSSDSKNGSINIEHTIEEFKLLWRTANKVLQFPETRRIGFVGEFRIENPSKNGGGVHFINTLTKFTPPDSSTKFHLNFEARELTKSGGFINKDTDDFWNKIFTFYISDIDERPQEKKLNANIDIQKYYNPAKIDPIKELRAIHTRFTEEKLTFKKQLKMMGFYK